MVQTVQTIVEYLIITGLVVVGSLVILGVFSDTVRKKIAAIIKVFDPSVDVTDTDTSSEDKF